jgi:uncharacterized protein YegL
MNPLLASFKPASCCQQKAFTFKKDCMCMNDVSKVETNICVVLDISASMGDRFSEVIQSINQFIKIQQKEQQGFKVNFSLMKFGQNIQYHIKDIDLQSVRPLHPHSFTLEGSTSLYDAIGKSSEDYADKKNLVMCIITDGLDNSSRQYTKQSVKNILDTKQKYVGWSVIYLSNSLETFAEGQVLNVATNIQSSNKTMGYDIMNQMNRACSLAQTYQRNRV